MDDPTHERSGPPPTRDALIHMSPRIWIRRAYEPPSLVDGHRVLVDRLWPRGISKTELRIDTWARDVAPSDELRRWFGHDATRWNEFRTRYRRELEAHTGAAAVEFAALVDRVAADHVRAVLQDQPILRGIAAEALETELLVEAPGRLDILDCQADRKRAEFHSLLL